MDGPVSEDVQREMQNLINTMTPGQLRALVEEFSSSNGDNNRPAQQQTRDSASAQEMTEPHGDVEAADIVTPRQAIAYSDMMRTILSNNPLADAAAARDGVAVTRLLRSRCDVNYRDGIGETALYVAAARGYADIVSQLLSASADPNLPDFDKIWAPLHAVCQAGNESMVRLLVDHGADPRIQDNKAWTPLHVACLYGNIGCIRTLIEKGAEKNAKDNEGRQPMHVAVDFGQTEVIRALVNIGIALDCQAYDGTTPLHLAATARPFPPQVELLLRLGAQVDLQDNHGATPLLIAVYNKTSDPELLIPPLLRWSADVDAQTLSGISPVYAAIGTYKTSTRAQYLRSILESSEELNTISTVNDEPTTPLIYAIMTRNMAAVEILLKLGADPTLGPKQGDVHRLPIVVAAAARNPEQPEFLTTLLSTKKVNPNSKVGLDISLLHVCAMNGNEQCIEVLLEAGADIDTVDGNGSTPLQIALENNNLDSARALVSAGADVNAGANTKTGAGSALHLAMKNYDEDLLLALIRADADPTAKDRNMDTPLDFLRHMIRTANSARQTEAIYQLSLSYDRVLGLMLEKMADRDAEKFGWPSMGEEGWFQAQLSGREIPLGQQRPGPRLSEVKEWYAKRDLKQLVE